MKQKPPILSFKKLIDILPKNPKKAYILLQVILLKEKLGELTIKNG